MTTNSLLRVTATALFLVAACKSEFPAGSYDDGVDKAGPATCRPPSPDYGPTSVFPILPNGTPAAPMTCSVACGTSAWPLYGNTIDIALPYGACAPGTPPCSTIAAIPCACANAGRVDSFNCSCEGGTWICGILSVAAVICTPCPDAGVGNPDGGNGDSRQAPDLSPDSNSCIGGVVPRDQQSCVNATCIGSCDWNVSEMNVTSAPGGPLLTEILVTSGSCIPAFCASCSSLSVYSTNRAPPVGTTCDLVAVATDGRSQSFRITVVQSGSAVHQCCGDELPPYSGQWVTHTPLGFDPPEVVIDFNRDGGVFDAGVGNPDAGNDAAPAPQGVFVPTGNMTVARCQHTATLLPYGKVLIAGGEGSGFDEALASAELYDAGSGTFTATGSMTYTRWGHTATLLPSGKVLVVGGLGGANGELGTLASAELFDPGAGTFTVTGSMTAARRSHTATLLPNGKVLIAGALMHADAELYDPTAGTFTTAGNMTVARWAHTATLLLNGKVLIAGGASTGSDQLASAELYDPADGTFTATGNMTVAREDHLAALLGNGMVLIAGGVKDSGYMTGGELPTEILEELTSAELFDPATGAFTATGDMAGTAVYEPTTMLPNGEVLIASGNGGQLYDPVAGTFTATGSGGGMDGTATLLLNGKVLIAGGLGAVGGYEAVLASAWLYQ